MLRAVKEQVHRFLTEGVTPERVAQAESELAMVPLSPQRQLDLPPSR